MNVFLASCGNEASLRSVMKANSRSKQSALRVCFNGKSWLRVGRWIKGKNIGHQDKPRPTYVSDKSDPEYKPELINLLEVVLLDEMLGLD